MAAARVVVVTKDAGGAKMATRKFVQQLDAFVQVPWVGLVDVVTGEENKIGSQ